MKKKAFWAIGLIAVALVGIFGLSKVGRDGSTFKIALISIVEIEPIAELRKGFRQEFEGIAVRQRAQSRFHGIQRTGGRWRRKSNR